jgi:hypothetical protein
VESLQQGVSKGRKQTLSRLSNKKKSSEKNHRKAEAARTWERLLSEVKSVKDKPAAAIEEARAKKYQTYNPLLYVIKKQVLDGRRQREPRFTPAAVTTFGELGPPWRK